MLDDLKELLFGPDYEAIIKQKNRIISNFEEVLSHYKTEIEQLKRSNNYLQQNNSYYRKTDQEYTHTLVTENRALKAELEAIKQADKTLLEALCLNENIELKQRIKELEDIIQSTKDYYKDISV